MKRYVIITLKAGRQIKEEIPYDPAIPVGSDANHENYRQLAFAIANYGTRDNEHSTENKLIYIAPAEISRVEIVIEGFKMGKA